GDLFLARVGAHVDDGQVLVAHILDHGADVDAQQVGRADQQHADRQHAHGGERHQPVGAQVVQTLPDQVGKAGKTHGIPLFAVALFVVVLVVFLRAGSHLGGVAAGDFGVRGVRGDHAVGQRDDAVVV